MKKFSVLVVACLLWATSAFAAEKAPSPGKVTVTVSGKKVAILWLDDYPTFGEWKVSASNGVTYDSEKGIATASGKFTIEVKDKDSEQKLLQMAFEDATVEIDYGAVPDKK